MDTSMRALDAIAEEICACKACGLHETRTQAVPGNGASDAQIVFVGEAPGAQEDKRGLPLYRWGHPWPSTAPRSC